LVSPKDSSTHYGSKNKALLFVFRMGLVVLGVCWLCGLLWCFVGDRSFDLLGRYINIAGVIFIFFGFVIIADRYDDSLRGDRRRKISGEAGQDTRLMMFLSGVGLLCLFIGNLIILGL